MKLANFLRVGLLLQLGLGTLLAWWLLPERLEWLALPLALLVPPVGTAVVLAIEFIVGAIADPRTPPLPLGETIPVWWAETLISLRVFSFTQPFAARFPEPPLVHDPQRPAVLLVHGYLCNRAVWRALLGSGKLAHCNVATVDLEPIFGPMDEYADVVRAAVEKLRAATGAAQVTLVGHSMGGLAIRVYLRKFGAAAVRKAITLATPHYGTLFGPVGAGANAKSMAGKSAFMRDLEHGLSPALVAKFVCVATRDDNLIVPRSSPLLAGARHVLLDRVGHLALVEDPRAWQLLETELAAS
jgi:triacylglycerol esterase/lipase EstA (alpha/beta hydrolase family)